jgi:acyl carrier protein
MSGPPGCGRLLSDQFSLILRRNIDPERRLGEYGVDSLGALELRTRIESETGARLTSSDIATTSIRDLASLLCEKLDSRKPLDDNDPAVAVTAGSSTSRPSPQPMEASGRERELGAGA